MTDPRMTTPDAPVTVEQAARCLTPGCRYSTEIKTHYAHSSYGNARVGVTALFPEWKGLKASKREHLKHVENILHRHMEAAVAEIGQYDLTIGGTIAKDWPKPHRLAALASAPAGDGAVAEIVELARRDIAREQTDFLGRMAQSLCTYEGIFADYPDGDLPKDAREEADDEISALAGLALAQLVLLRHPCDGTDPAAALARPRAAVGEREAEIRDRIINTPETADFMAGVPIEAAHQRERWGVSHDGGKTPFDWFWLIGYLSQKAAAAQVAGDNEKALHHTISTAAALANWHAQISGRTDMRPGIGPDNGGEKSGSAYDLALALQSPPAKVEG